MTVEIRKAAVKAIAERFGLPVYGQRVEQGGKRPCFTVETAEATEQRLLGRRAERKVKLEIVYFDSRGKTTAAESTRITEGLYEALRIIGEEEKFAAAGLTREKTKDGVRVTAEYGYHILYDGEEEGLMLRLRHNGREAVGYEKEGDISQGTAMQK